MATNEGMDLALVGYEELIKIGEQMSVDKASSLSRPDLVSELRKRGVGVLAQSSLPTSELQLAIVSLTDSISCMSQEIVSLRQDRADKILSLELEVQQLRREVQGLQQPEICVHPLVQEAQQNLAMSGGKLYSTAVGDLNPPRARTHISSGPMQYTQGSTGSSTHHMTPAHTTSSHLSQPVLSMHGTRPHPPEQSNPGSSAAGAEWSEVTRRRVTSRYVKPQPRAADPRVLTGPERTKKLVLYVGNVSPGCRAESITAWCKARQVDVLNCSISENTYLGTSHARVTVAASDEDKVLDSKFWPATIQHTVRKWRFADAQGNKSSSTSRRGSDDQS